MTWRTVCISQRAKLEYRFDSLRVRGESTQEVHLSEMAILMLETTAVSITGVLLHELTEKGIRVILCDPKHMPYAEIVPYHGRYDSNRKIHEQLSWSEDRKALVWKLIIRQKIISQAQNLLFIGDQTQANLLQSYAENVEAGDSSNREGHAAKVYFNSLFGYEFSRDQDSTVNACLDFAYSLVLSCVSRTLSALSCITQLGIWHDSIYNPYNLSCDIMEVFRPFADRFVLLLDIDDNSEFDSSLRHKILEIYEMQLVLGDKKQYLLNAIDVYARAVIRSLTEDVNNIELPTLEYV